MGIEWSIADAPYGSEEMIQYLQTGYEPFAVVPDPELEHIVYFRLLGHTERDEPKSSTRPENMVRTFEEDDGA